MTNEYPFHKGARVSLYIVGVLLILLVFTAPVGAYIIWRVSKAKLTLSPTGVHATSITTVEFAYADVVRLGVCKVPIIARGIGGALARYKVGGDHGVNISVVLRNGKKKVITISMYERHQEAMELISSALKLPYEELTIGAFGLKWPEQKAA